MAEDLEQGPETDPEEGAPGPSSADALGAYPVAPPDPEVPTVVVQPKARAKRQAKAKAAPPPPEPEPEPKRQRTAPKAKAVRDGTGRFLPKARPPEEEPEPPSLLRPQEEPESAFASLARALHGARQRDMQARQQLYQGFVHGL